MEYEIKDYCIGKLSLNYDLRNYREMYSRTSSAEQMYNNILRYVPNTTRTGAYINSN